MNENLQFLQAFLKNPLKVGAIAPSSPGLAAEMLQGIEPNEQNIVFDRSRLAESTADDSHPQGARLCGHCRGRCCQHGAGWNAFIDLTVLQRWQQIHPEQCAADAVQAYLSLLPGKHVERGCLYQTAQGCVLPRELRADICNGFACPQLQQVQASSAADRERPILALGFGRHTVERVALITEQSTQPLSSLPPGVA